MADQPIPGKMRGAQQADLPPGQFLVVLRVFVLEQCVVGDQLLFLRAVARQRKEKQILRIADAQQTDGKQAVLARVAQVFLLIPQHRGDHRQMLQIMLADAFQAHALAAARKPVAIDGQREKGHRLAKVRCL